MILMYSSAILTSWCLSKKEIEDKFDKVANDKKKATTALPAWSSVCRFGDLPDYFKAPKVNESFSRLLHRLVSNSR